MSQRARGFLGKSITTIKPVPPFDFELTAGYHTYFQGRYGTDSLTGACTGGCWTWATSWCWRRCGPSDRWKRQSWRFELQADGLEADEAGLATAQVAWLLGTGQGLTEFYALARSDSALSAITKRYYGLHLPHTASVFEALVLAILGQQIATNVARIIRTLMIESHGLREIFDGETYYAFPRPETLGGLSVDQLRGLKLSQRKSEYVKGIAQEALENSPTGLKFLHDMPDEVAVQKVLELRGVGHWTAQWVLIRVMGRSDALPRGDLALRRAVSRVYFGGSEISDSQLEEFSWRWSPWRTYAMVYLSPPSAAGWRRGFLEQVHQVAGAPGPR